VFLGGSVPDVISARVPRAEFDEESGAVELGLDRARRMVDDVWTASPRRPLIGHIRRSNSLGHHPTVGYAPVDQTISHSIAALQRNFLQVRSDESGPARGRDAH
jgi:hypothetical protein